jgi:oligopeptide/dipeptide ABC transporter ATP-binding protein
MAVMYLGSLVESGPSDAVFFEPKHPYTQLLIASNPEADPAIERTKPTQHVIGEITSPVNLGPGCRFADRCPKVLAECHDVTPEPMLIATDHQVACHLYAG